MSYEAVYDQAEDVKAFARELACLPQRYGHGEPMDPAVVGTLANADPLNLPLGEGLKLLLDPKGVEVHEFAPIPPRLLPAEVEALALAIKEPTAEPVLAEGLARHAYGLEEQPETHYARPWADRREDLVQEGLHLVVTRTAELQALAEHQAVNHVSRLWVRLQDAMDKVSTWSHDLVATWKLSREVRKVERDVATFGGPDFRTEPLPSDPAALRELLHDRQKVAQKASEASRRQREEKRGQDPAQSPPKDRRGGGGMPH